MSQASETEAAAALGKTTTEPPTDELVSAETSPKEAPSKENDESTKTEQSKRRKVGKWFLGETLGRGAYSWVKKGYDIESGHPVALKFLPRKDPKSEGWSEKQLRVVTTEIEALKQMKHPNIIRLLAYNFKTLYPEQDGKTRDVILIVLEYMSGGELFDLLYYTSKLNENIARTYFHQLIDGLEACHKAMIVHRDIKPQNLLLDKFFSLKISDFGLAKLKPNKSDKEETEEAMNTFQVGTLGYQAPEILLRKPYSSLCDVFSAGVVLFILLVGYPPFETATETDRWYGSFVNKQYKQFWAKHKGCGVSKAAMDLITRMILFDPEKRIGIDQIKRHPWYLGEILDKERLHQVLYMRHMDMETKRAKDPLKGQILNDSEPRFNRSIAAPELGVYLKRTGRTMQEHPPVLPFGECIGILDSFTTVPAYEVLNCFLKIINFYDGKPNIDFDNYTISATMGLKLAEVDVTQNRFIDLSITVFRDKKYNCNVVKYRRLNGDIVDFVTLLRFLQNNAGPALTGLPKECVPENQDKDVALLQKYFPKTTSPTSRNQVFE